MRHFYENMAVIEALKYRYNPGKRDNLNFLSKGVEMKKFLLIMSLAIFVLSFPVHVFAEADFSENVAGTYLITASSGQQRLWTFTKDGDILGTSSVQPKFDFSTQQGVWEVSGKHEVTAVLINFGFNKDNNVSYIGRLRATLKFDEKCRTLEGKFTLRKFEAPEDPMKPETDAGEPIIDTIKGQCIFIK